jgi:tetratricopeptide (TPR) repeat protein
MKMIKALLIFVCFGFCVFDLYGNDIDLVKSLSLPGELKTKYYNAGTAKATVDALNDICFYLNNVEPEKAKDLSRITLRISDSINYLEGLYDANNNIGISFYRTAKYQQALSCLKQAAEYAKIIGNKGKEAAVLSNMAMVYVELSDYDRALSLNNQALKIRSKSGDSAAVAISLNNIGMTYHQKGEFTTAMSYYFKASAIKLKQRDKDGIANSFNNIGQVFFEMCSDTTSWAADSALSYFLQAYNYYNYSDNRVGIAKVLLNLANVYSENGNMEKALDAYRAALNAQKFINDSAGIALTYYDMALCFTSQNDSISAENHFIKSLTIADRFDLSYLKKDNLKQLFLINNKRGNYKTASLYADRLVVVDECINELSRISFVEQYNGKYEYQVFENMNLQKDVSRTRLWLIIVTTLALSLSGIIVTWCLMRKKQ